MSATDRGRRSSRPDRRAAAPCCVGRPSGRSGDLMLSSQPRTESTASTLPTCAVFLPASSSETKRTPTFAAPANWSWRRPCARRVARTILPVSPGVMGGVSLGVMVVRIPMAGVLDVLRSRRRALTRRAGSFPIGNNTGTPAFGQPLYSRPGRWRRATIRWQPIHYRSGSKVASAYSFSGSPGSVIPRTSSASSSVSSSSRPRARTTSRTALPSRAASLATLAAAS